MRTILMLAAGLLLFAMPALADPADKLQAAKEALQTAKQNLRDVPTEFEGHRKKALENVDQALHQVNEALQLAQKHDRKDEKKADQLENKVNKMNKRIDNLRDE